MTPSDMIISADSWLFADPVRALAIGGGFCAVLLFLNLVKSGRALETLFYVALMWGGAFGLLAWATDDPSQMMQFVMIGGGPLAAIILLSAATRRKAQP